MDHLTDPVTVALDAAAAAVRSVTCTDAEQARLLVRARNAIDAELATLLGRMDATKAHEAEGASSIATWADRELNQDAPRTRALARSASTYRDLPRVASAAAEGRLSQHHVESFGYLIKHLGPQAAAALEEPLLDFALNATPREFHAKCRQVRDRLDPDELDAAWLRGMLKHDIRLARTLEGWHLTGHLPIDTGAKLKAVLGSLATPRAEGDTRTAAERRVDALDELLDTILAHGMPADNGIRPHLHVVFEHDEPVDLEGFGAIGPALAMLLGCIGEYTPYLVDAAGDVTAVGRSKRLATSAQARAIRLRQRGQCAAPGCRHPIAHNHHIRYWSHGGTTDLDNLVGLCRKCHTLVHADRLRITGDHREGYVFHHARGSPLARAG